MTTAHDFDAVTIDHERLPLSRFKGGPMLVVNTASECGYTPQYEGLQALHEAYAARGLAVLGFPCDQFGHQEPGTDAEIATFCSTSYDVTFAMFSKVDVNGPDAHPLFAWLQENRPDVPGGAVRWNFTKFLVDGEGALVARYEPKVEPADLAADVERLLAAGPE